VALSSAKSFMEGATISCNERLLTRHGQRRFHNDLHGSAPPVTFFKQRLIVQTPGLKRDFESPAELTLGNHESRVQIAGPQPPISKTLEFSVDLI